MNYQTGFVAQSQYLSIHAIRRVMTPSSTATTNNMLTSSPESNHSSDYLTNTMMFMPFSPSTSSSSSSLAATATHGWKPRKPRGSISTTTSHQLLPTLNINSNANNTNNTNTLTTNYPASAPPASTHLNNNDQSISEMQDDEDDELALWNTSYNDESNMMNMGPRSAPMQIPKPLNQSNFGYDHDEEEDVFDHDNDVDFYQNSMYASSVPRAPPSIFHQVIADKRKKYMTAEERERGKERSDFVSQLFVSPDPNMPKSGEIIPGKPPSEIEKEKQLRYLEEKYYRKSAS